MATISAYCSACDTEIEVRIPRQGLSELELRHVDCPHADVCEPAGCVLSGEGAPLRDSLEWLPPEGASREPRGLEGASRLVELARRSSFAREIRRWRRWWGRG